MARTKIAALLSCGALLALAACSGGDSGGNAQPAATEFASDTSAEISFTWWGNDDRADRFNQALDLFNEEYPNVTVVRNFNSWGDYWTARNTEAAGRALPDVLMMDAGYISEYADKHLFLDLAPYQGGLLDLDGFSDQLLGTGTINGELSAVPMGSNLYSMMYNKDVLDELGIDYPTGDMTWDELGDFVLSVNEAGASFDPRIYGSDDYAGGFPGFIYRLMQQGKPIFDEDGGPAFTESDVLDYLNSTADLRDADEFYPIQRSVALSPVGGFLSNETAIWFNFSTTVQQAMSDTGTENIGMTAPPVADEGATRVLAEHPSMLLTVSANTEEPDAAVVLVDFLANSPEVRAIFGSSLGTPPTEETRAAVERTPADVVNFDYAEEFADQVTESYPLLPAGYGSIEAKWGDLHEELLYGEITTEQFVDSLFTEMSLVLGS